MISGKNNGGYITVGDKADITVFKKVPSNLQITDRYNNSVILDSTYKCVLNISEMNFLITGKAESCAYKYATIFK